VLLLAVFSSVSEAKKGKGGGGGGSAKVHIHKGMQYFDLQQFPEAAHEYELAFKMNHNNQLLFYIGQAWRLAGQKRKAAGYYQAYLKRMPGGPDVAEAQQHLAELTGGGEPATETAAREPDSAPVRGAVAATEKQAPPDKSRSSELAEPTETQAKVPPITEVPSEHTEPPVHPATAEDNPGKPYKIAGFTLLGVGLAAAGVGIGLVVTAVSQGDDYNKKMVYNPSQKSKIMTEDYAGIAMLAVGGAAVVTGTALAIVGYKKNKDVRHAMLVPSVSPSFAGASLHLDF
jgi:hypothetical protein